MRPDSAIRSIRGNPENLEFFEIGRWLFRASIALGLLLSLDLAAWGDDIGLPPIKLPDYATHLSAPPLLFHWTDQEGLDWIAKHLQDPKGRRILPTPPTGGSKLTVSSGVNNGLFASEDPVLGMGTVDYAANKGVYYSRPTKVMGTYAGSRWEWLRKLGVRHRPPETAQDIERKRQEQREKDFAAGERPAQLLVMQPAADARLALLVTAESAAGQVRAIDREQVYRGVDPGVLTDPGYENRKQLDLVYHLHYGPDNKLQFQEWLVANPEKIAWYSADPEVTGPIIRHSMEILKTAGLEGFPDRKRIFFFGSIPKDYPEILGDYLALAGRDIPPALKNAPPNTHPDLACGGALKAALK